MTRSSRNKSKSMKQGNNDNTANVGHELNGNVNVDTIAAASSSTNTISDNNKKRLAAPNDEDSGPPCKKVYAEEQRTNKRKRGSTPEGGRLIKEAKIDKVERQWQEFTMITNNGCGHNCNNDAIGHSFIVASLCLTAEGNDDFVVTEMDCLDADVLCLQQVSLSSWAGGLERRIRKSGYGGDLLAHGSQHGVATLYKQTRFEEVEVDSATLSSLCYELMPTNCYLDPVALAAVKQYLDEPDAYVVTVLRDKTAADGRFLIVGNTHLSHIAAEKPDLRCVQAASMFWRIHNIMLRIKSDATPQINDRPDDNNGGISPCWILCGDFNSEPNSAVYQICRDGYPNDDTLTKLQSVRRIRLSDDSECALIDLLWHSFQHPLSGSYSTYLKVLTFEPTKDCIWMSDKGLRPHKVLLPCSSCAQQDGPTGTNMVLPLEPASLACSVAFMT